MHRAGRTGRFGTAGLAVTLVTAAELAPLQTMVEAAGGRPVAPLPEELPDGATRFHLPPCYESEGEGNRVGSLCVAGGYPTDVGAYELDGVEREAFKVLEQTQLHPPEPVPEEEDTEEEEWEEGGVGATDSDGWEATGAGRREPRVRAQRSVVRADEELWEGLEVGSASAEEYEEYDEREAGMQQPSEYAGEGGAGGGVGGRDGELSSEEMAEQWEQWRAWASHWWWAWWAEQHFPAEGGYLTPAPVDR
jgi:superfamily II DNA/RNA helicase